MELNDTIYDWYFWIIGDSIEEIEKGNFKLEVSYHSLSLDGKIDKGYNHHKDYWDNVLSIKYHKPYNFFPRGKITQFTKIDFIVTLPKNLKTKTILDKLYNILGIFDNDSVIHYEESDWIDPHYTYLL